MMMKSNMKYLSTSDTTSVANRLQGTEHQLGHAIAQLKLVNKFGNLNSIVPDFLQAIQRHRWHKCALK